MSDADLIELGRREIDAIGLVKASEVVDGCVVRMPKAYPVYDDVYQEHLAVIRGWLKNLPNLHLAGRNGMHKYNNQDHSMMTAVLAARNILGLGQFDPGTSTPTPSTTRKAASRGPRTRAGAWCRSAHQRGLIGPEQGRPRLDCGHDHAPGPSRSTREARGLVARRASGFRPRASPRAFWYVRAVPGPGLFPTLSPRERVVRRTG